MKKIYLFLIIVLFGINSCKTYKFMGYYDLELTNIVSPQSKSDRYSNIVSKTAAKDSTTYTYSDSIMDIKWMPLAESFSFSLTNKSNHSLKIIWDDAVFVDIDGSSSKIVHSTIKYAEVEKSQTPTIVGRKSFISDNVWPAKNIYYQSYEYPLQYLSGWKTKSYLPVYGNNKGDFRKAISPLFGKQIKIIFPIQIEDIVNDYEFTFTVNGFNYIK